MVSNGLRVVVDDREKLPYAFADENIYGGVHVTEGHLPTGDYSLWGLTHLVAVERKSLPDLVNCLGNERERFVHEMIRGRGLESFAVVCECTWQDLAQGQYRSHLNPHSACQSVASFVARFGIPFLFAGSRTAAEYVVWSLLKQYAEGQRRRWKSVERALAPMQSGTSAASKRVWVAPVQCDTSRAGSGRPETL